MFKRIVSLFVIISFILSYYQPAYAREFSIDQLPEPGTMVSLSSAYEPVLIKGLKIDPSNPLALDFIVATGNSQLTARDPQLKKESEKLIKYFFAALTLPEKDVWVNLSPYEKDRIIPKATGETEMGRDMLAQDYILKQITASLIYPEKGLGKDFWNKIYTEAYQRFGTTQIPVNTFNKVWIMADKASVYESRDTVFVVDSHLKVMLEEDYMALNKHQQIQPINNTHALGSKIVREIVLPALEKEVNEGRNFANLRQIFHSLILAKWYKETLKTALLNQVYSNKDKIAGLSFPDASVGDPQYIYQQYLKAYKKGVFNYIKEDIDQATQQPVPRKYFSGGVSSAMIVKHATAHQAMLSFRDLSGLVFMVGSLATSTGRPAYSIKVPHVSKPYHVTFSEGEIIKQLRPGLTKDGFERWLRSKSIDFSRTDGISLVQETNRVYSSSGYKAGQEYWEFPHAKRSSFLIKTLEGNLIVYFNAAMSASRLLPFQQTFRKHEQKDLVLEKVREARRYTEELRRRIRGGRAGRPMEQAKLGKYSHAAMTTKSSAEEFGTELAQKMVFGAQAARFTGEDYEKYNMKRQIVGQRREGYSFLASGMGFEQLVLGMTDENPQAALKSTLQPYLSSLGVTGHIGLSDQKGDSFKGRIPGDIKAVHMVIFNDNSAQVYLVAGNSAMLGEGLLKRAFKMGYKELITGEKVDPQEVDAIRRSLSAILARENGPDGDGQYIINELLLMANEDQTPPDDILRILAEEQRFPKTDQKPLIKMKRNPQSTHNGALLDRHWEMTPEQKAIIKLAIHGRWGSYALNQGPYYKNGAGYSVTAHVHPPFSIHGKRILIAEDDTISSSILEKKLAGQGAIVETVMRGDEAYSRTMQGNFDLVVTDEMMPFMKGDELVHKVRESKPDQKFIMWTSGSQDIKLGIPVLPKDAQAVVDAAKGLLNNFAMNTAAERIFAWKDIDGSVYQAQFIEGGNGAPQPGKVDIYDYGAGRDYTIDDQLPRIPLMIDQKGKTVVTRKRGDRIIQQVVYSGNRVLDLRKNHFERGLEDQARSLGYSVNEDTKFILQLGDTLDRSRYYVTFNAGLRMGNENIILLPVKTMPNDLEGVIRMGKLSDRVIGFNITSPHKVNVMRYMDGLDQSAQSSGAVEAVVKQKDGTLRGYSWDGEAWVYWYTQILKKSLQGRRIVVLGAGGAARSLIHSIGQDAPFSHIVVYDRQEGVANILKGDLVKSFNNSIFDLKVATISDLNDYIKESDMVINLTGSGKSYDDRNPAAPDINYDSLKGKEVYDANYRFVYDGAQNEFLKRAKVAGAKEVYNGLGLSVATIPLNIHLFTGKDADYHDLIKVATAPLSEGGAGFQHAAMIVRNAPNGGIDLNASKLNLQRQGSGVQIKFDPAMIERFKMGNFDGIVPVITHITPIADIYPLLGLKEPEENEKAAA